jgi:hypothetical protein
VFFNIHQTPTFTFQTATSLPSALSGKLPSDATLVFPDSVFPDSEAPVITLNGAATITIEVGSNYNDAGATATDNYDASVNVTSTSTVNTNVIGTYTVIYDATDIYGNSAESVTRTVNVVDTTKPVITLNGSANVTIEVFTSYIDAGATVTDNYDASVSVTPGGVVDVNTLGTYTITYTATDIYGNSADSVTRTVNVVDTTKPVITISGGSIIGLTKGDTYNDAGATGTDNLDGVTVIPSGTVNTNIVGGYTITYTATDSNNNTSTAIRKVYVYDPPDASGNVCFLAGTPIQTNQGQIPIEKLNPKIHTIRGKTIQAITKTITPDDSLICFEPNSLGNNLPSRKTVISMNHKIFYQGKMTKAKYFVGNTGIYKIPYTQETLYNVLLETHDKMVVNNMICETLDPRNTIAQLYMSLKHIPEEKHASVFSQYNAFCKVHNIYGTDSSRPKSKGAAFRPKL